MQIIKKELNNYILKFINFKTFLINKLRANYYNQR